MKVELRVGYDIVLYYIEFMMMPVLNTVTRFLANCINILVNRQVL